VDVFKSKRDALLAFLDKGMTMVHLDARRDGVLVPKHFIGQQDLRLNLSYRFAGSQMEVGDEGIEATLTFGGNPFRVRIPFGSVYALTSHVTGAGLVFPESLPEDILAALRKEMDLEPALAGDAVEEEKPKKKAKGDHHTGGGLGRPTKAPHLRVIEGEKK
jgi:stringent starvation protein B